MFPVRVNQNIAVDSAALLFPPYCTVLPFAVRPPSTLMDFFSVIFRATVSLVAQPEARGERPTVDVV